MGFNYEQYKTVLSKNNSDFSNCDGYSNVTGDVADLQEKVSKLKSELKYFEDRSKISNAETQKCALIKPQLEWENCYKEKGIIGKSDANNLNRVTKELKEAIQLLSQQQNIAYNNEKIRIADLAIEAAKLKGTVDKNAILTKASAEADKKETERYIEIKNKINKDLADKQLAESEIAKRESDLAIEFAKKTAQDLENAKSKEQDIKKEIDLKLVNKVVVPEAELKQAEIASQVVAEATKKNEEARAKVSESMVSPNKNNKKYFIIGGILVAVIGAFLFFRKK
jgi:hypothetical protein